MHMKYIASAILLLAGCSKDAPDTGILGKWNIISDSYYSGVAENNHMVTYKGAIGDYYNFDKSGKLYIKEGTNFETLTYQQTAIDTIFIESFPKKCHIKITDGNAIIISPVFSTPGGSTGRSVYLNR